MHPLLTRPLILAATLLVAGLVPSAPLPYQAVPDPDPTRFGAEIAAFEQWDRKNAAPRRPVLFVGSSSIRQWPTAESFPGVAVVNRGFGGAHISDVGHFVARVVLKYAPSTIVFYAGDNDIAAGKSPQQVFDDYRAFVDLVHGTLPETAILFLPIKPSLSRWAMWSSMAEANDRVRAYSDDNALLHYADVATPMLGDDGKPRPSLFVDDGLHLTSSGYELWTSVVARYLAQMPYSKSRPGAPSAAAYKRGFSLRTRVGLVDSLR